MWYRQDHMLSHNNKCTLSEWLKGRAQARKDWTRQQLSVTHKNVHICFPMSLKTTISRQTDRGTIYHRHVLNQRKNNKNSILSLAFLQSANRFDFLVSSATTKLNTLMTNFHPSTTNFNAPTFECDNVVSQTTAYSWKLFTTDIQYAHLNATFIQKTATLENLIICTTATVVNQHNFFECYLRCCHAPSLRCAWRLRLCPLRQIGRQTTNQTQQTRWTIKAAALATMWAQRIFLKVTAALCLRTQQLHVLQFA